MKSVLLALLVLSIVFFSCQKNFDLDNTSALPILNNLLDSTTLTRYVELDTTRISGLDTLDAARYYYDVARRLTRHDYTEYDVTTGTPERLFRAVFYYTGTDTLPFKKIMTRYNLPGLNAISADTAFYLYSNGKIISDSSTYELRKFNYGQNNIQEKVYTSYYGPTPVLVDSNNITLIRTNGNLIVQRDTIGSVHEFLFTYDNKNNPFYKLPAAIDRGSPYYHVELYNDEMIFEKNNPTDINQNSSTSVLFHFKYTYEYNANGYPKVARVVDQNDTTIFYKVKYFYTQL